MIATIEHKNFIYKIDLSKGLDISIPLSPAGPRAWYVDRARISPVINQQFVGSVRLGGSVNFNDVHFNPHGNGTHTESVGHISSDDISVNSVLKNYFFLAELLTVTPVTIDRTDGLKMKGDKWITKDQLQQVLGTKRPEAVVIRTMPNDNSKLSKNYSNTNFPYFSEQALTWLAEINVQHFLVDLPSVDREEDGGLLEAHHAFWKYPIATRNECTITEFIYVEDKILDGTYVLNLQMAPFENDAAPSRPVLYALI